MTDEETIVGITREMTQAQSADEIMKHWADDVVWFDGTKQMLCGYKAVHDEFTEQFGRFAVSGATIKDLACHVTGSLGFVMTRQEFWFVLKGKSERITVTTRQTDGYEKRGGEWKLVHQHVSMALPDALGFAKNWTKQQEEDDMFVDYHVHTAYSDDSVYAMEEVVKDAISKGMAELCFTDHVDYGIKRDWDDPAGVTYRKGGPGEPDRMPLANVDYPRYVTEIQSLKERYKDQIALKLGLEFGLQRHTIPQYASLFARYPFDFIILSVHEVDDKELWTGELRRGVSREAYYRKYYEEMLALVETYHDYSVLGHMDLATRYDKEGAYPFDAVKPLVAKILKTVIADGKGIEVNTSSHRYGLPDLTPSRDILKLYRELGGAILTIGSDSHKEEHLGDHIPETLALMKELGFDTLCTFEKMKPIFHRI